MCRSSSCWESAGRASPKGLLGFAHIDAGHGWLVFKLPPAEVAVHPTDGAPKHEFYLRCDDLDAVLAQLIERGAELIGVVTEERWGRLAGVRLPSGGELPLYQPLHLIAHSLD
ncbi:extradiol dioxygenase [Streptomyces sp. NPDC047880]|uniref:VOC family protein n=1 Tax=Streptomyces sp. NPDC047880 TaxID=3155626 RepID=UPI0034544DCA